MFINRNSNDNYFIYSKYLVWIYAKVYGGKSVKVSLAVYWLGSQ